MPKQKYDWIGLKTEFMKSNHESVSWFLYEKWIDLNTRTYSCSKWWAKEKKEFYNSIQKQVIEDYKQNLEKELIVDSEYLFKWKRAALYTMLTKLKEEGSNLSIHELSKMLLMIDRELKNVKVLQTDENTSMSDEDWKLLNYKRSNQWN